MKFKPPELPKNPTHEEWEWWQQCFVDGLAINEITTDAHKLTMLRSHAGAQLFPMLKNATSFDGAITILDGQFKKPTRLLFARHQTLTCRQKDGEDISTFVSRLKLLVEKCECKELDIQAHKDNLLCDAFVAGVRSDLIRARLLELSNEKATADECISIAGAVELSTDISRNLNGDSSTLNEYSQSVAAIRSEDRSTATKKDKRDLFSKSSTASTGRKCGYCNLAMHPRPRCPAKDAQCHNCGKPGHWAKACRAQVAALQNETDEEGHIASVLCAWKDSEGPVKAIFASITINRKLSVSALIDPGSSHSYITIDKLKELGVHVGGRATNTRLANGEIAKIRGQVQLQVALKGVTHECMFNVVTTLIADAIIGMDLLSRYRKVCLNFEGSTNESLSFSATDSDTIFFAPVLYSLQ